MPAWTSSPDDLAAAADRSAVRMLDPDAERAVVDRIDAAKRAGDTLGGVCEVVATGLPVGLGSHVSWDRKLDGRLAQAILSIPAVKGVEIGLGFEAARRPGSAVHDEIARDDNRALAGAVRRHTNRAGGLEGGITTGEPLVLRVAMKPISTLMRPLGTVDLRTGESAAAAAERSDVTAVPAMGVIAEAMTAFVLAQRCSRSSEATRSASSAVISMATSPTCARAFHAVRPSARPHWSRRIRARSSTRRRERTRRPDDAGRRAIGVIAHPTSEHEGDRRATTAYARRHLVLVGLPGAGKSTVGPRLAAALGRPFLDLDAELERRVGMSVAAQFGTYGEPEFRRREAALSVEFLDADAMVLAPGGGWLENAAASAPLRRMARIIYLRVTPETALARLRPVLATRPLLAEGDPLVTLHGLLARRSALYESADDVVDAGGDDPARVTAELVRLVRATEEH
jgi:shikimate kinase